MNFKSLFANSVYIIFLAVLTAACTNTKKHPKSWSSSDPTSIPYEVRKKEFDKGNLVVNASFEDGNIVNGKTNQPKISKWSVLGNNVFRTNIQTDEYEEDEAHDGNHAIKITRPKTIPESGKSDGIISNFIPVIPGNYSLYYDIRLENVFPSKTRLGTKLYDAIDIQLRFFDANKKEISGSTIYPYHKKEINTSFKGYTFSNFYYIDKFPWGRVNGRTYNYPFSEGDIPDDCHYVKIFLGLQGRGLMWVDNVDFRFSRWNFTAIEKLKPFFEKEYDQVDLLVPTPKVVKKGAFIEYTSPLIITPSIMKNATRNGAEILKKRIDKVLLSNDNKNKTQILSSVSDEMMNKSKLIFSIGNSVLYQKHKEALACADIQGKEQGYCIKQIDETPSVIFLIGNNEKGDYYAAATAAQLLDDKALVFQSAEIIDYPDFTERSCLFSYYQGRWKYKKDTSLTSNDIDRKIKENNDDWNTKVPRIEEMTLYKLNKVYSNYVSTSQKWFDPPAIIKKQHRDIGQLCEKLGVLSSAMMVNPYYHFEYETEINDDLSDSLRYLYSHHDKKSMEKLKNTYRVALDNGAKTIMFNSDDFTPHTGSIRGHYDIYTKEDRKRFVNLANAQAYVLNELNDWLKKEYPGAKLEFCPAPYLNEFIDRSRGDADAFFRDIICQLPEDIAIIWTGNTVRSLCFDVADIKRYTDHIKRPPMLWDNTLYARTTTSVYGGYPAFYPGKTRMCNIFEPIDLIVPEDFHKYMHSNLYVNAGSGTENYKIKMITVGDFGWNVNAYDPDFSLYKALLKVVGKENAKLLLEFNDYYYAVYSTCMKMERLTDVETNSFKSLTNKANVFLDSLDLTYEKILESITDNDKLIKELEGKKTGINKKLQDLLENKNLEEKTGKEQI